MNKDLGMAYKITEVAQNMQDNKQKYRIYVYARIILGNILF